MGSPLTVDMVAAIAPNARANGLDNEFSYLLETCRAYEITTKNRVAAFLTNVFKESGELYYLEEIADGSAYEWREDLENTQAGDGTRYKGRGYLQITGRGNYRRAGEALGVDLLSHPELLEEPRLAWLSAGWYWRYGSSWENLNGYADAGDFRSTILGVRGGPDPDREHYWWTAMEVLPDDLDLSRGETRMVKASEIVAAARSVIGAPYRMWYEGASIPMYRDDGYSTAPPVWFVMRNGVMCFPGDTKVLADGVEKSYKRVYRGELVTIKTASGKKLSGTPNHPVLTRRGWVALNGLKKGDHVVSSSGFGKLTGPDNDHQHEPTHIQEVHGSLASVGPLERVAGAPLDFHGDGREGEVEVVYPDRALRDRAKTPLPEQGSKLRLPLPHFAQVPLVGKGLADVEPLGSGSAPGPFVRGARLGSPLFVGHPGVAKLRGIGDASGDTTFLESRVDGGLRDAQAGRDGPLGFSREITPHDLVGVHRQPLGRNPAGVAPSQARSFFDAAPGHSRSVESLSYGGGGDTEALADLVEGLPFDVRLDKVVSVDARAFDGHVYNLQTKTGHYVAEGIVTHNCSDLLNLAREMCGLPPVGGTEAWEHFITDWSAFDPDTPGIPGAVAVNGYTSESEQGHVILYTGEHSCVQALLNPGVTEDFTDYETYGWGGWCDFQWYGLQPDIDYSEYLGGGSIPVEEDWQRHGYFDLSDLYVPGSTGHDPKSFWGRWVTAGDGRDYIEVVRED